MHLFSIVEVTPASNLLCLNKMQKDGIKKMDMQSTKEFLAELKVLAHVHHLNLVNSLIILVYYLFLLDYITSLAPAQFRLFIILQSF